MQAVNGSDIQIIMTNVPFYHILKYAKCKTCSTMINPTKIYHKNYINFTETTKPEELHQFHQ